MGASDLSRRGFLLGGMAVILATRVAPAIGGSWRIDLSEAPYNVLYGDTATDYTTAVNGAMANATDGQTVIAGGDFRMDGPVNIPVDGRTVNFIAEGAKLYSQSSGSQIVYRNSGATSSLGSLRGLYCIQAGTQGTGTAFDLSDLNGVVIQDCYTRYFANGLLLQTGAAGSSEYTVSNYKSHHCVSPFATALLPGAIGSGILLHVRGCSIADVWSDGNWGLSFGTNVDHGGSDLSGVSIALTKPNGQPSANARGISCDGSIARCFIQAFVNKSDPSQTGLYWGPNVVPFIGSSFWSDIKLAMRGPGTPVGGASITVTGPYSGAGLVIA